MVVAVFGITIIVLGFVSHKIAVPLGGLGVVYVKPASFWGTLAVSTCRIERKSQGVNLGDCALYHTYLEAPVIVLPLDNGKTMLCVYDFDVGLRLLKIDTGQKFQPYSPGNELAAIVHSSSWKVDEGNKADWREAIVLLEKMPIDEFKRQSVPALSFGFYRVYRDHAPLLEQMRRRAQLDP